ncbi:MAG: hypothetical protein EBY22_11570, partial [Gammaproteobacteria bacterium]|nr:hypothetical protein [Gammaproteobacteria bacterium]
MLKKNPNVKCSPFANTILIDYNNFAPNKKDINFDAYLETMGYLMGFRELVYSGEKSYTSESIFTNVYSNYLFFVL